MIKQVLYVLLIASNIFLHCKSNNFVINPYYDLGGNFHFNNTLPLKDRLADPPAFVIDKWKKFDKKDNYIPYKLSYKEKEIFERNIEYIPQLNKNILQERLIAFYFIENFLGSAAADPILDKNKNLYFIIIINPKILTMNLSEVLRWRDQSCFINDELYSLNINCGKEYDGILYSFLHESTHVVDFIKRITPFVIDRAEKYKNLPIQYTDFVRDIWNDFNITKNVYSYRELITFYGFNNGPKIKMSDALNIYNELCSSPFVSLYGSKTWSEDIADMVTFYYITEKLKQPYIISLLKNEKVIFQCEPMKNVDVQKRLSAIIKFNE